MRAGSHGWIWPVRAGSHGLNLTRERRLSRVWESHLITSSIRSQGAVADRVKQKYTIWIYLIFIFVERSCQPFLFRAIEGCLSFLCAISFHSLTHHFISFTDSPLWNKQIIIIIIVSLYTIYTSAALLFCSAFPFLLSDVPIILSAADHKPRLYNSISAKIEKIVRMATPFNVSIHFYFCSVQIIFMIM